MGWQKYVSKIFIQKGLEQLYGPRLMIKDNNNKNNGLYFTDSPFNILSVTELAESIKNDKIRWDIKISQTHLMEIIINHVGLTGYANIKAREKTITAQRQI